MRIERPMLAVNGASKGPRSAHIIVLANEKGGSGKTTTAMHVIVALLKARQKVATIDVDSRQRSLTHYLVNRRMWAKKIGVALELPDHHAIDRAVGRSIEENDAAEFAAFAAAVNAVEHGHDFVVIDTPAADSYLMRLPHAMADTLITPRNDSFVDFDVLARVDPESFEVTATSHYSEVVREARRQRRIVEAKETDWIVKKNHVGMFELARRMGFRLAEGFSERVVYCELFLRGLTVLDTLDETTLGQKPNLSHHTAGQEVRHLIETPRLSIDGRGGRRAAARAGWMSRSGRTLGC